MGKREHDYLTNPATGKSYTPKERLERLRDQPFAEQRVEDASATAGQTLAERQAARKAADEMGREVAEHVAAKAAENRPPVNPFSSRIAELERRAASADPYTELPGIQKRLAMFRPQAEQWEAERAAEAKRAEFLADPGIVKMTEDAEILARSHKHLLPDCSPDEVAYVTAVAKSGSFATVAEQTAAYWQASRALYEKQYAREDERTKQQASKTAAEMSALQQQQTRRNETAARIAHAAKMGGTDEPPST